MTDSEPSEMVERVARAQARAWHIYTLEKPSAAATDAAEERDWPRYVFAARAAVAAMREPTDWMSHRGGAYLYHSRLVPDAASDPTAASAYREMIDAALSGSRTPLKTDV